MKPFPYLKLPVVVFLSFLFLGTTLTELNAQNYRASAQAGVISGTLTLTINKPAGTVNGDVMIAAITVRPATTTVTVPTGWTQIARTDQTTGTKPVSLITYWKAAGAAEPTAYSWSFSASSGIAGGISTFYNVYAAAPIHASNGQVTSSALTHATPSITTTAPNTMIVTAHSFGSSALWTAPAGMAEIVDVASDAVPNTLGTSVEVNYVTKPAAGATGTKTATASANATEGAAQIISLLSNTSTTISYAGSPYCTNSGTASVTQTGATGGTYTSSAGLSINSATGVVTLGTSTAGTYTVTYTFGGSTTTASIVVSNIINNNTLDYTNGLHGTQCTTAAENATGTLTAPTGTVFISVGFASYGTPTGTCPSFVKSACHATTSQSVTESYVLGNNTASIPATNAVFGDPCNGTVKTLDVAATYTQPVCSGFSPGTITGTTPTGGNGTYTYLWEKSTTSSTAGYTTASGTSNAKDYTSPILTQTTWYRRTVTSGGCTDASVIQVTVIAAPSATISYAGTPYCSNAGTASVTFSGTTGGTYSSTTGLSINSATGDITLGTSTPGTYTVTYTMTNTGCTTTATASVTITALPVATFSYSGSPYCKNASNPSPTFSGGGVAGTFSSTAGLVFVSTSTGQINLASSTAGTYTVTNTIAAASGCPAVTATSSITITTLPVATFSYTASPYCKNASNPSPTFSGGGVAGTFSSTAGLVFVSTSTGQINLASSTAGTYTVTNTIAAANGCPVVTATSSVTITTLPVATFNYSGSPYCKNASNPSPTFSGGGVAGTFSSTAGLVFVSTSTGQIDLAASTAGTYTITNTIAASGGCPVVTATSSVTITTLPVATFSYSANPYCKTASNPSPTFSGGGVAGTFSSTAGLVFVSTATGQIDLAASTAGTYTVTNTIAASGGCPVVTATLSVTITTLPVATFSYSASPYCKNASNPSPTFSGGGVAGTFSSTTGLVFVSTSTGQIDLAASTAGIYTVTNTITASGGCPVVTATSSVTISTLPVATFSYSGSPYCKNASNPSPTFSGGGVAGAFSSTAGLVFVSTSTGQINLAASTAGTYTVTNTIAAAGGCPAVTATSSVTITTLPVATFSYSGSPYCKTSSNPSPTFSGAGVAGTFSSTAGLVFVSTSTGQIDLAASTVGTYTVTNTIAASAGCPIVTATASVTISAPSSATISYAGSPYCSSAGTATVTFSGTAGGTYSSTAGLSINSSTGDITLGTSTAGTYAVTYTMLNGGCTNTATTSVTVTAAPSSTISYAGTPYCSNAGTATVTRTGTAGGSYSSTAGLTIDATTGAISLASSTAGTYTVTYTVGASGGCAAYTTTASVTVTAAPFATISYAGSPYCSTTGTSTVTQTGTAGGTYSSTTGLTINSSTGDITLGTSTAGTYTVTYTVAASAGCAVNTATTSFAIGTTPTVSGTSTATCVGGSTGTITASASGGSSPYTYSLNAGAYQASATFSGLAAGTYTVNAKGSEGCVGSTTVTISPFANSTDDPTAAGTNTWIGHAYDGTNFSSYIGRFTETETFNESFGGNTVCFNVVSNSITRSIYTETFSVKFRMNSTKRGLYTVDLGSDDGSRLTVDGTMVSNQWNDHAFSAKPSALLNLNGGSLLLYEFYENGGNNQVQFQNLTLVLANTLSSNTTQSICTGNTGADISGDIYGTLPSGITLSGTGYQWSYSTTPGGARTNITGATGATFTPDGTVPPFNTAGTYYVYRNAVLSSVNNVSPNPYIATNESNAAIITVTAAASATINYIGSPYCSTAGTAAVTRTGTAGGTYSSTTGLTINSSTGAITLGTSTAGTYTITYSVAAAGPCAAFSTTTSVSISDPLLATINYTGTPYCSSAGTATVTATGATGGTYSSTAGLSINSATGDITLGTSTAGTYTVTYTMVNGGCTTTATTSVTVTAAPSATITYAGSPYCSSAGIATVTRTGTAGGSYSSTAGLTLNTSTGSVTLASSTAGTYTVTYTVAASGGCATYTTTATITITTQPNATGGYAGSPYCSSGGTATPSGTSTGATGTFSSAAGLSLNSTTGVVTLGTSTPGAYTVTYTVPASGGCATYTRNSAITITAAPSATISYAGSPYCSNSGTATVTQTGTTGGTYSSTTGLNINSSTGDITLGTSTVGTYTVTYSVAAAGGCAAFSTTTSVTITAAPTATINYSGSPYCTTGGTVTGTRTGRAGGTYSSTTGLIINSTTGAITLASSTAGTYIITYTIPASGGCSVFTTTATVTVSAPSSATISYGGSPYCSGAGTALVTRTGTAGGTYSSTTGLTIDGSTGDINLGTSTPGTYSVTYTMVNGGCTTTATTSVTVTPTPSATINYTGSPYCTNAGTATVTRTGTAGGTYSSTSGLTINSTTGAITLASSTAGTYTITYSVAASGGCAAYTTTTSVTVTAAPSATISYAGSPYCLSGGTATVARTGTAGGSYSSTSGLSINSATGDVTLGTSTAGTYTVTYTVAASGGCAAYTTTASIIVSDPPSASISYGGSPYCLNAGTATVTRTGTSGGTYSSTSGLTINSGTGDITLGTSTAGTYTVTYTVAASGGCAAYTTTTSVTLTAVPSATISYPNSPYCINCGTATTLQTGTTGGTYSSTAGLSINATTGTITLASSTPGTYTVTYTVPASGGCASYSTTTSVTINAATNTYYVNDNSNTGNVYTTAVGNDANSGTQSSPFLTINRAISVANAGDTIYVDAGSYGEEVHPDKQIFLFGANAAISPNTGTRNAESILNNPTGSAVNVGTVNRVAVKGFKITGNSGYSVLGNTTGHKITLEKNLFDNTRGLNFVNSDSILIVDNRFNNLKSSDDGFFVAGNYNGTSGTYIEAYNNTWINSQASGMNIGNAKGEIYNNVYSNITYYGILVAGTSSLNITRNVFSNIANPDVSVNTWGSGVRIYTPTANMVTSITNNYFNNNFVGVGVRGPGNLAGTNITVSNNLFSGNTGANINNAATGQLNAICNWFGANDAVQISSSIKGDVLYSTFLKSGADNDVATPGFQPAGGTCSAPSATISYAGSPHCTSSGTGTVTLTGTTGGTFSSTAGLTINSATGDITLGTSTPGIYTVTYTIPSAGGWSQFTTTTNITVSAPASATVSYAGSPYCTSTGSAPVTFSGTSGGKFTSTTGLVIDSTSGSVNLYASSPGTYTVTYTVAASGGCAAYSTTANITVNASPAISQLPATNLIANYKFEGDANDATGNNNGTLQNNPTLITDRFGIANKAFSFNGSNQYVSSSNSYSNPTDFTISIWFKTTSTTGGKLIGFGNAQTGLSNRYDRHIYMNNAGKIYFGVYPGTVATVNSALSYNDGNWHLATATLSSTSGMVLYIDGTQAGFNATTTGAENYTGYWRIGYDNLSGWTSVPSSYYFNGALDDALIYQRALSSSEVAVLYNSPDGAGNNSPVCSGSPLNLTATTVSGATYAWTGPNGFTSSLQNPTLNYNIANAGIYTVQVTSAGCTSTAYTNITSTGVAGQWTGNISTDWSDPANWCNGVLPTSTTHVVISASATRMPVIGSIVFSNNLTINSGASVTISSGGNLKIAGNLVNNGTYTDNGTTTFNGPPGAQGFSGVSVFNNLTINNIDGVILPSAIIVKNNVTLTTGVLNSNHFHIAVGGNWINNTSATAFIAGTGTVTFNGTTAQSIGGSFATTFNNLAISNPGNTVSLLSNINVGDDLSVNAGTLDLGAFTANRLTPGGTLFAGNNATLKIGGTNTFPTNFTVANLVVASTVEYSGTNQAVSNQDYGNLKLSSSGGAAIKTLPATPLNVNGNLVTVVGVGTSVAVTAAAPVTVNGNVNIGASTSIDGGSYNHSIGGNWVNNGIFTGNTSTVTFTGSNAAVSGTGAQNFNNLTIAASGITFSANTIQLSGNLATVGSGSFSQASGGILVMNGTGKTITGTAISLNNLSINGSVTTPTSLILTGNLLVNGSFSASNGTITMSGSAKTISGTGSIGFSTLNPTGSISTNANFTVANGLVVDGSFSASAGTATFTGTSFLSGTANLYNATVNGTKLQLSAGAVLGISNALTITSGSLDVATSGPNTVNFNGNGAQNVNGITYSNLVLSNGNTKTAVNSVTTLFDITIGAGTTFDPSSFTHSIYGNWVNNGTFIPGTSTVEFVGPATAYIRGNTNTTFNILTSNTTNATTQLILQRHVFATTVNMINGIILTGLDTLTITGTRTGNGYIYGNIQRNHVFTTGVAYAFEGPDNTITFSSVSGVNSITVSVTKGAVSDFPFGGSISRVYNINIPSGTYSDELRLHYEDDELNGNNESSMGLWQYNGTSWISMGKSSNSTTANYVEQNNLTNLNNRWTLSDNSNLVQWNGSVSSDWNTAANWTVVQGSGSRPPTASDIVDLGTAAFLNQPTISNNVTVKNIIFGSAQSVTLDLAAGGSLTTLGDINGTWSGNMTHIINVNDQSLTANGNIDLSDEIAGHAINLNIGSGTVTTLGLTESGGANVSFTGAGNLNIFNDFTYSSGTFTPGSGTVTYNGTDNQEVASISYNNLTINKASGLAAINNPVNVAGDLLISSGQLDNHSSTDVAGNVTINAGTTVNNYQDIHVGGNWNNNGTYIPTGSSIYFDGSGTQYISGSTFNNFILDKPSDTAILTGNVTLTGDVHLNSGILDLKSFDFNRNVPGGVTTHAAAATLIIGANNPPKNFSSSTIDGPTILNGNVPQFIGLPGIVFADLIFQGTGVKTLLANMTVKGNLRIDNGATFKDNSSPITLNGNWVNNGTFIPGTGDLIFAGTSKTISGNTTFYKANITGSYVVLADLTYNKLLNVTSTGSITSGAGIVSTVHGDLTNNGTLITYGTAVFTGNVLQTISLINSTTYVQTVVFDGSVSPILTSTSSPQFADMIINNTGGINPSVGWIIFNSLIVSSGASFNGGSSTHTLYGSLTNNGTITSSGTLNFIPSSARTLNMGSSFSSTGLVIFGGAGEITLLGTPTALNDVLISNTNAAGVTPVSNWNLLNDFTINSNSKFNAGTYTYSIGDDIANQGTLNSGTSTFILDGSGEQDIWSGSAFNNLTVNKSGGVITLSANALVNGTLDFISGNIQTDANAVILGGAANLTGAAQNTGWVYGNLQKNIATGAATETFEVGDDVDYAPATIAFDNVTTAGTLTVSTIETEHPDINNSVINPDKSVNRYWTMANNGIMFTNYDATFNFVPSDVDAGATTSAFKVGLFNGSSWSLPGTASPNATDIQATDVTSFGDFAIGEVCNDGTAISYADTFYCSNAGIIHVALTGTAGGTFTSSAGLSIDAATGDIDPATSVAGSYSITYTIEASGSCPVYITTSSVTITTPPSATIAYPATPYCSNAGTASVTLTGTARGTFSSTPGLTLDPATGNISLATSTAGTYTVTYTVAAFEGCAVYTTTTSVTITAAPSAIISYASSPYCSNGGTASVTFSGTAGGTYSSATGLSINSSTGAINLGTSTAGTYTVTYSIAAGSGCAAYSTTTSITITSAPAATISYAASPHCAGVGTSSVSFSGTTGGTYSSTAGLTIDATTGTVDVGTSTAGIYTVTYTVAATGGCAVYTTTANITITPTVSTPVFLSGATSSRCQQAGNVTYAATADNSTGITYTLDATSIAAGNSINAATAVVTYVAGWSGTSVITAIASGCNGPATATHTVTINAVPLVSGTPTITCVGGSAGTITASGSGATAPYSYSLDAGAYQSSPTFIGLAAGTYTLNIQSSNGCYGSTSVVISTYPISTDDETETGTDSWVGHVYDGINFDNYIGHYTEAEEFDQNFGGTTCFDITSNGTTSSIYTDTYSIKYRMTSTRRGLYVADLGSDDGSRLTVDGALIYNSWSNQSFAVKPGVLMSLNGSSSLMYEYYDNLFSNRVAFQNVTQILANALTTNITQSICMGSNGIVISGDEYGTLPAGITLSGTGYQWSYSTTPGGVRNNIPGATGATYTPSTSGAPFNTQGTFYIYRNATLSSSNNISPDPYVATNESDAAVITVSAAPSAAISYGGSPYCSDAGVASVTFAGTTGGIYSSTAGLSIDAVTGAVDINASLFGTYTVTYTVPGAAPCGQYETTTTIIIKTAGVWIGAVNADWNNSGNWLCGAIPTASTNILIQASMPQYPVLSSGISAGNDLTIESGAFLTINNNGIIQIGGNITNNGTFNVSNGTIEMNGATPQTIPAGTFAANKIKNLVISNDVTLAGQDSITGVLSFGNTNNKTFSTGGYLTLKSSAAGTARVDDVTNGGVNAGNIVIGDVSVERYISPRRAWRLLTAPVNTGGNQTIHDTWQEGVNNTSLNYAANQNPVPGYGTHITWGNASALGFDVGVNNNPSILGYDNGSIAWEPVTSTNIDITSYPAYMIFVRGDRSINLSQRTYSPPTPTVLRTTGELRTGNQSFDVAPTGFTVIGNPYASAIDLNNIAKGNSTNIQDNFYLWDPNITGSSGVGGFVNLSWNGEFYDITPFTGDGIGQYIQSGSAFLARSSDGVSSGTLVVKEADKTALGVNINRPSNMSGIQKITTILYSVNTDGTTSIVDGSLNAFGERYSNEIDQMDAVKLGNFAENLLTVRDGQKLTVERRQSVVTKDTIYYRINQMKQKQYNLEITADGFESGVISAWFEDTYLHTSKSINLEGTTSISFRITGEASSYAPDRFRLVFKQLTTLPVTINSIKAWQQSEGIQVEWKTGNETNIKEYEVEKSADGLSFTRSASVKITGQSNGTYNWLDENAKEGNNYYRIKSIGIEGIIKYSTIAKVYISKGQWQIVLNTNIIRGGVIGFRLNKMPEGRYGVRMLNSLGQVIFIKQLSHAGGNGTASINVNTHLAKGMYMVEFTRPDKKITKKVFVE